MQPEQIDALSAEPAQRVFDIVAQAPAGIATAHFRMIEIGAGPMCRLRFGGDVDLAAAPLF